MGQGPRTHKKVNQQENYTETRYIHIHTLVSNLLIQSANNGFVQAMSYDAQLMASLGKQVDPALKFFRFELL
jgi:hypothetical protein